MFLQEILGLLHKYTAEVAREKKTILVTHKIYAGVISSGNAWERRSQSYFDSGHGVPRNGVPRNEIVR